MIMESFCIIKDYINASIPYATNTISKVTDFITINNTYIYDNRLSLFIRLLSVSAD